MKLISPFVYCWFIMTMDLCKHFVHNGLTRDMKIKCLHRPIDIINQQYTKGQINFINNDNQSCDFLRIDT